MYIPTPKTCCSISTEPSPIQPKLSQSPMWCEPVELPINSTIRINERTKLATMIGKAMSPPSFADLTQKLFPLKMCPRKRITGNASIGKRTIKIAFSIIPLLMIVISAVLPIIPPQCFKRFTSSSEIVSCWPYMARKIARPIATSEAAIAIAKIAYTHPVASPC